MIGKDFKQQIQINQALCKLNKKNTNQINFILDFNFNLKNRVNLNTDMCYKITQASFQIICSQSNTL